MPTAQLSDIDAFRRKPAKSRQQSPQQSGPAVRANQVNEGFAEFSTRPTGPAFDRHVGPGSGADRVWIRIAQ
ncbi:MAG TPA: hypothetical protein VFC19_09870 [Candidatus Limnocylindrales bacterium]|nr:hypothetical protein [Candidatus Limnocylindrales bacterium]